MLYYVMGMFVMKDMRMLKNSGSVNLYEEWGMTDV